MAETSLSNEPMAQEGAALPLTQRLAQAAAVLNERLGKRTPKAGVILGSGLGSFAERLVDPVIVDYAAVPYMARCTATSHKGRWVCGRAGAVDVLAMQGRFHGYEGYSAESVAFPVWLMHELGIPTLITTNAAGAINETFHVGEFCLMSDHINFTGRNPVVGIEPNELAPRFFSMYEAYDPALRARAKTCAEKLGIAVREGVYLGLLGPSFETPAEIRAFRSWGADTVAMSVVEEVIAARQVGMAVLGISLITNMACGVEDSNPLDDEVLEVGSRHAEDFATLITAIVQGL